MIRTHRWTTVALGVALSAGIAGASEKVKQDLSSTGIVPGARGKLQLKVKHASEGELQIRVQKLSPNVAYEVIVGGVKVATVTTSGNGSGRLKFSSRPHSHDRVLGFDPRGEHVSVRGPSGDDVLEIEFPESGNVGAGDVICCIPDDSGPECEDRTPAECAAAGGTATTATSCLADPCGSNPPVTAEVICCLPDDSGPECEDRTQAECTAAGGLTVQATTCLPDPCSATPPPAATRCCVPDDSGPSCEDRTPAACAAAGGIDIGPGSCTPNPCP